MGKLIYLPDPIKKEMETTFKTSKVSLWKALNFKTNSPFAKMLRAAARERGGVLYDSSKAAPGYYPDCITSFETADRTMTQKFSDRVYLIADMSSDSVAVYKDGEMIQRHLNVTLSKLSDIQSNVESMAKQLK